MMKKFLAPLAVTFFIGGMWGCGVGDENNDFSQDTILGDTVLQGDVVAPDDAQEGDDALSESDYILRDLSSLFDTGNEAETDLKGSDAEEPEEPELIPRDIAILPKTIIVQKGTTEEFWALLDKKQNNQAFTWDVSGNTHLDTAISEGGLLTVADNETADFLVVMARLKEDDRQVVNAMVTVSDGPPETYSVTVNGGQTQQERYKAGRPVSVTATEEDKENLWLLKEWQGDGDDIEFDDVKSLTTFFVMPARDVEITADYYQKVRIDRITVSSKLPQGANILYRGGKQLFAATARDKYESDPDAEISWSVSGNESNDTFIEQDGWLHIALAESASELTIVATSVDFPDVSGSKVMPISEDPAPPTVLGIRVYPEGANQEEDEGSMWLEKGDSQQFYAVLFGFGPYEDKVEWRVTNWLSGDVQPGTSIDETGFLIISEDEIAQDLIIWAEHSDAPEQFPWIAGMYLVQMVQEYEATVVDGTGSGVYESRTEVPIKADAPPSGMVFHRWVVENDCETHIRAEHLPETTFSMPFCDVTIKATYIIKPRIDSIRVTPQQISLERGTRNFKFAAEVIGNETVQQWVDWYSSSTESPIMDDGSISISANEPADKITITVKSIQDPSKTAKATIDVTNKKYHLTVIGGTGSGDYPHGSTVTIMATPPAGQSLNQWDSSLLSDRKAPVATFVMPKRDVTITASFIPTPPGRVSVNDQELNYEKPCLKVRGPGQDLLVPFYAPIKDKDQCFAFFDALNHTLYLKDLPKHNFEGRGHLQCDDEDLTIRATGVNTVARTIWHKGSGRLTIISDGSINTGTIDSAGTIELVGGMYNMNITEFTTDKSRFGIKATGDVIIRHTSSVNITGHGSSVTHGIKSIEGSILIKEHSDVFIEITSGLPASFGITSDAKIAVEIDTSQFVDVRAGGYGYISADAFLKKPNLKRSYYTTGKWNSDYVRYDAQ